MAKENPKKEIKEKTENLMMLLIKKKMKRLKLMIVQKPASNTIEVIVIDLDNVKDFVEELEVKKKCIIMVMLKVQSSRRK